MKNMKAPISTLQLSYGESQEVQALANSLAQSILKPKRMRSLAERTTELLPDSLLKRMQPLLSARQPVPWRMGPFFFHVTQLESTPTDKPPNHPGTSLSEAAATLILISSVLGKVITYRKMKQSGKLFQSVFPIKELSQTQTAASSCEALTWHTEHATKKLIPDYLALFCLRNPKEVGTTISVPQVNTLKSEHLVHLRKLGVISRRNGCTRLRYDPLFSPPPENDIPAQKAYEELGQTIQDQAQVIAQVPGYIVMIPNTTSVHARESFHADFNGHDRWLIRTMIRTTSRTTQGTRGL